MAEISREPDFVEAEENNDKSAEVASIEENKHESVSREVPTPRMVNLQRRNQSFGLKIRGQVVEGGPRWLIDGQEYKNLQTISAVLPNSTAEEGGVLVGDKILEMYKLMFQMFPKLPYLKCTDCILKIGLL